MIYPLPLQFCLQYYLSTYVGAIPAMLALKKNELLLEKKLQRGGGVLSKKMQQFDDEILINALSHHSQKQFTKLLQAIYKYNLVQYKRYSSASHQIFAHGTTKCYQFEANDVAEFNILLIPSMVNRHYIFDINQQNSLIQFLVKNNLRPFIVDWDEAENEELQYGLDDYICKKLLPIFEHITKISDKPIILLGYCMGGLFALALSAILEENPVLQEKIKGVCLLATPWDFCVDEFLPFKLDKELEALSLQLINKMDKIPASFIQMLFYLLQPEAIEQKFNYFLSLDEGRDEYSEFIAIEHWCNDGVAMPKIIWQEVIQKWLQNNETYLLKWCVNNKIIDPNKINLPFFFVIASNDKITPPKCAIPLAKLCKNKIIIEPECGHVAIILAEKSKEKIWLPFLNWIKNLS